MSDSTGNGVDLAALVGTVDAVRRDVEGLRRRIDNTPATAPMEGTEAFPEGLVDQVATLEETVDGLAETLEQHTAALAALGLADDKPAPPPAVVCWLDMTDGEQARVALTGLGKWLGAKLSVYAPQVIHELLPCWTRHPDVVQLLFDLQGAYEGAYHATGRVLDAWDIRTRYLRQTKEGLTEAFGDCAGGHGSRTEYSDQVDDDPLSGVDLVAVARAWAAERAAEGI